MPFVYSSPINGAQVTKDSDFFRESIVFHQPSIFYNVLSTYLWFLSPISSHTMKRNIIEATKRSWSLEMTKKKDFKRVMAAISSCYRWRRPAEFIQFQKVHWIRYSEVFFHIRKCETKTKMRNSQKGRRAHYSFFFRSKMKFRQRRADIQLLLN